MRFRLLPCTALLAVSACGGEPARMTPPWSEPPRYVYTLASTCGEQSLIGTFAVTVENGAVTASEGLDSAAKRALTLRIANLVPTLGKLVADADQARSQGAQVSVEHDPADGHPTGIRIDPEPAAVDDESCYAISDYRAG